MHVKYVASNVKGGVSVNLGEKTLIVGRNGTGKSAILNSIELAIGGFASDIAGREEMAKESELVALAPERKGELFARALLSDGTEASWKAGEKGAKKAVHTVPPSVLPDLAFPLRPVRDAIRGKPETARKFFLSHAMPNITIDDVMARIPEALHQHFRTAILKANINDTPVDKLLMALDHAKSKARTGKTKAKGAAEVTQVVADGLAPLPTEEVINAVKKEQKEAQKVIEAITAAQGASAHVEKMRKEAEPLQSQLQQAEVNIGNLQAAVQQADGILSQTPTPANIDEHTQRVLAIVEKLSILEQTTGQPQSCPVCKTPAPHGTFVQRQQAAQMFLQSEQAKAAPYQMALEQRQQVVNNLASWTAHAASIRTQLEAVQRAIAAGNVTVYTGEQVAAAKERLEKANAEITRIDTIKAQWEQAKKAKETVSDATKEVNQWDELYKACDEAIRSLLDVGVDKFVARVQSFLPSGDRFALHLREEQKQVFRFGLMRSGVLHTALSGAEWARVIGAISGACASADKLSVLIPEDRAFDGITLYETLMALANVPGQIIIATPSYPLFNSQIVIPDGWKMINTDTGAHRNEAQAA